MSQAQGVWKDSRQHGRLMVTCMPGIFCASTMHSGCGCIDSGWLAASRVLMFLDEFEERTTGTRTSLWRGSISRCPSEVRVME